MLFIKIKEAIQLMFLEFYFPLIEIDNSFSFNCSLSVSKKENLQLL